MNQKRFIETKVYIKLSFCSAWIPTNMTTIYVGLSNLREQLGLKFLSREETVILNTTEQVRANMKLIFCLLLLTFQIFAGTSVIVCGPKSSGVKTFGKLLESHPNIDKVLKLEYPQDADWPDISQIYEQETSQGNSAKVICVSRDKTCNNHFAEKSLSPSLKQKLGIEKGMLVDIAADKIHKQMEGISKRARYVASYETLHLMPEYTMRQIFRCLAIDEEAYDYSDILNLVGKDQNALLAK